MGRRDQKEENTGKSTNIGKVQGMSTKICFHNLLFDYLPIDLL